MECDDFFFFTNELDTKHVSFQHTEKDKKSLKREIRSRKSKNETGGKGLFSCNVFIVFLFFVQHVFIFLFHVHPCTTH